MATYVTSDAHGHLRALDRALELAAPASDDTIYVMGDMIDRGPDPVGVLKLVRSLPNARVLMGNHESMMLDVYLNGDASVRHDWEFNGGWSTAEGLEALPAEEVSALIDWIACLPRYDVVQVPDCFTSGRTAAEHPIRTYLLAHAGIDAAAARRFLASAGIPVGTPGALADPEEYLLRKMMAEQDPEDLLWIRESFWGAPTGFLDASGAGPIVIAGHTPTVLLANFATQMGGPVLDEHDRARIVEVGACQDTGGIADRIDIDASAATGAPHGRVSVMRLEDHAVWYGEINEGE